MLEVAGSRDISLIQLLVRWDSFKYGHIILLAFKRNSFCSFSLEEEVLHTLKKATGFSITASIGKWKTSLIHSETTQDTSVYYYTIAEPLLLKLGQLIYSRTLLLQTPRMGTLYSNLLK